MKKEIFFLLLISFSAFKLDAQVNSGCGLETLLAKSTASYLPADQVDQLAAQLQEMKDLNILSDTCCSMFAACCKNTSALYVAIFHYKPALEIYYRYL